MSFTGDENTGTWYCTGRWALVVSNCEPNSAVGVANHQNRDEGGS